MSEVSANTGEGRIEWFGGNHDALALFRQLITLAHTWDDIVDQDKPVSEAQINQAFLTALVYLPLNPFYQKIQSAILPMWITTVSAYQTANAFERAKDAHGVELAHTLRYMAGNIIAYAVHVCIGAKEAQKVMPEVWKAIAVERFSDYQKEVLNVH